MSAGGSLGRRRAELTARLAALHPNDPRRGLLSRRLRALTSRQLRAETKSRAAAKAAARREPETGDLFAMMMTAGPQDHHP